MTTTRTIVAIVVITIVITIGKCCSLHWLIRWQWWWYSDITIERYTLFIATTIVHHTLLLLLLLMVMTGSGSGVGGQVMDHEMGQELSTVHIMAQIG